MPWYLTCECGRVNITASGECRCEFCGRDLEVEGVHMPRIAHEDKPIQVHISLPASVVSQVQLRLYDPLTQKIKYGEFSTLLTSLMKRWLSEQNAAINEPSTAPLTTEPVEEQASGK